MLKTIKKMWEGTYRQMLGEITEKERCALVDDCMVEFCKITRDKDGKIPELIPTKQYLRGKLLILGSRLYQPIAFIRMTKRAFSTGEIEQILKHENESNKEVKNEEV